MSAPDMDFPRPHSITPPVAPFVRTGGEPDYADDVCPCNNDPFGNGPCAECRAELRDSTNPKALTVYDNLAYFVSNRGVYVGSGVPR